MGVVVDAKADCLAKKASSNRPIQIVAGRLLSLILSSRITHWPLLPLAVRIIHGSAIRQGETIAGNWAGVRSSLDKSRWLD